MRRARALELVSKSHFEHTTSAPRLISALRWLRLRFEVEVADFKLGQTSGPFFKRHRVVRKNADCKHEGAAGMASLLGKNFAVTTFGESHGPGVGVVIDGCPPGIRLDLAKIQAFLARRRPGQSVLSTPRDEQDQVEILSGTQGEVTLGSSLAMLVRNKNTKPQDYADITQVFRPSHADFTTHAKFGLAASSGGGRASARETIGRVAAAAVAEQVLEHVCPDVRVYAFVDSVKDLKMAPTTDFSALSRSVIDRHALRCPDDELRPQMEQLILSAKRKGDSVGGTICGVLLNVPPGLGEPVFDKLEADLAKAMLSLPASKGFEIGSGFAATAMYGSEHNDAFIKKAGGRVGTATNRSGGVQGGISNGEPIYFRVAFKPVATVFKEQQTVDAAGQELTMKPKAGRHDPCVLPRAVPMVEAMSLLTVMDHLMRQRAQRLDLMKS